MGITGSSGDSSNKLDQGEYQSVGSYDQDEPTLLAKLFDKYQYGNIPLNGWRPMLDKDPVGWKFYVIKDVESNIKTNRHSSKILNSSDLGRQDEKFYIDLINKNSPVNLLKLKVISNKPESCVLKDSSIDGKYDFVVKLDKKGNLINMIINGSPTNSDLGWYTSLFTIKL